TSTTAKAKNLTVAIWDNNQKPGLQEIMDDWTKTSGVKVDVQVLSWDEYWTLLEAGASGGTMPDVFWMHSNNAQRYMENDLLLDLTDRIKTSDTIDMSNYYEDIAALYNSNGKQYAMPKDIDTIALWYNKTMFDEAGVAYPNADWTWEDLYVAAKALTKEDKSQYGYAINTGNNQDSYYNTIYSYGGYVLSEDKKTSGYDDPKTIEAMEVIEKILREGAAPDLQVISENGADVLFTSGKVAMITQGSWMVPAYRDNEYTFANADIAPLPKGPDGTRVSIYNGLGWAAAANTKYPEDAWGLIEYLSSKEAQLKQAELGVTMSAYKGTSAEWKNGVPSFNLQAYVDMLDATLVFRPYSRNTAQWEELTNKEFRRAWTGEASMAEVLKDLAQQMNAILKEE
ncbi:MAG: sugar ABC transporter substrate-binding protein, partial [Vallitaleaceae bacterium]|nr:sugar ABC transporter substrate-binding protein [Vallitaleaceae bacterium]